MTGDQAAIDPELCRDCGSCVEHYSVDAIALTVAGTSFMDRSIERIGSAVDVA